MEHAIDATCWVVRRALNTDSGVVLQAWAASIGLGPNVEALRVQLLYTQGMLDGTRGRAPQIQSPALTELLHKLQDLAYRADDVMDELDYFRIQDELDGTYCAADEHAGGCLHNHALNARHTARAIKKMLGSSKGSSAYGSHSDKQEDASHYTNQTAGKHHQCLSVSHAQNDANTNIASRGRWFLCCARPNKAHQSEHMVQMPKLKFDRVFMSETIHKIIQQLKPLCTNLSVILNIPSAPGRSTAQSMATARLTTSEYTEPKFYGRKDVTSKIIGGIIEGEYCDKDLTVLPIVGPGGMGKTTLMQYIYNNKELQKCFDVKLWVCVSMNGNNVSGLSQEIADQLKDDNKESQDKPFEERLKYKRFLLVLDDMWYFSNEYEWKRFLLPFTKAQKGSVVLVTTRLPALAQMVKTTDHWIYLEGLDRESFKELFIACAFTDKQSTIDHSELLDAGDKIFEKLKGSPLAAETVGRLLRNHLDLVYWTRVLESKEWESQNGGHEIMPTLKLSFDYLPFHLQQCFTYCALFPEDYKFSAEELIHFWIGLGVLHSRGENRNIEDIGRRYLTDLVDYGIFKMKDDEHGGPYYIIEDLLHELAIKVSADECLSICSSNSVRSIQIPPSIRHLSINIDESSVKDRMTFDICKEDFVILGKRLKVENLHSLMLFGKHQGSMVNTFRSLFSHANALRVIFISGDFYSIEDLLQNFSKLVHLRYLRIHDNSFYREWNKLLPSRNISRLYHLMVLDLQGCYDCSVLVRYMTTLINLRHFLVAYDKIYSKISKVGYLKSLQELRRFEVRKESLGFELRQIGHLLELCGSLSIGNLENVRGREKEAKEAKLMHKKHLDELILDWDVKRPHKNPAREEQVLEGLKPHGNLLKLSIRDHGGSSCPSWLGVSLSVKNLESLCLEGVAWKTFPPIGELLLVNEQGEEFLSQISNTNFQNLRRIELIKLAGLKKWVVDSTGKLFSRLEVLNIKGCPELVELSFSRTNKVAMNSWRCQQKQNIWFPRLKELLIYDCPKLLSLPPVPWTHAPCSVTIGRVGSSFEQLDYREDYESTLSFEIVGKDASDSAFWTAMDFHNLTKLRNLVLKGCPPLPLDCLQVLSSLKTLEISDCNNAFLLAEGEINVRYQCSVECISISRFCDNGKELTRVISYMPKLAKLTISRCDKITRLGMMGQHKKATFSSGGAEAQIGQYWQQHNSGEEEEIARMELQGLLLLPSQLQELEICGCPNLRLCPGSLDDDTEAGLGGRAGVRGLFSLRSLDISDCTGLSLSSSCFPFPTSLQMLRFVRVEGIDTLAPFSNLASLTELQIIGCEDLRGEGLWRLLAQGCLTELSVFETPSFFLGSEIPQLHEQGVSFHCCNLQLLWTDDTTGVLAAPICCLLSSSLTKFILFENKEMRCFTEEQEQALQLLTSLRELRLQFCSKLQCLPAGLHTLPILKKLKISNCPAMRMLPEDKLPYSLEELKISHCPAIQMLPEDGFPYSLQVLKISHCPAIQMLAEDRLIYSLRLLDVERGNSEELRRQCCRLIGTIPIVKI